MNRIKELRIEKGITQADLAKILKISDRAVGYYENGDREPDYTTLLKIAEYFDVSIDYLLGVSDIRNPVVEAYKDLLERKAIQEKGKEELVIGLSYENKGVLTEEDKEEITRFAEYVANRRKENNN